jgi:hypothetical protein
LPCFIPVSPINEMDTGISFHPMAVIFISCIFG